jgi:hypothetical protein
MAIRRHRAHSCAWLIGPRCQHDIGIRSASKKLKESDMAKGEQRGNRETKKPKKQKIKTIAAAPSQKAAGWQPGFASGKKK